MLSGMHCMGNLLFALQRSYTSNSGVLMQQWADCCVVPEMCGEEVLVGIMHGWIFIRRHFLDHCCTVLTTIIRAHIHSITYLPINPRYRQCLHGQSKASVIEPVRYLIPFTSLRSTPPSPSPSPPSPSLTYDPASHLSQERATTRRRLEGFP